MTKASENLYPKIIGVEGAAPGTPAAATSILYVKSDGLWYSKDDAGVETLVSGGTGTVGSVTAIEFIIDGAGSAITTGVKGYLEIPFACTLTAWRLLADQSGSIVVDVWKDTYANFPPIDADAMPGAGKEPTVTTSTKAEDTAITDWTTDDIAAGDILAFNVDSCTTITRVTLSLTAVRT